MGPKRSKKQKVVDIIELLTVLIFVSTVLPKHASAYLDPGSGSYVIQILIASLAAVGFFVKTYWNQIKSFFAKKDKSPKEDRDEQS